MDNLPHVMPRSPRRRTLYASEGHHNVSIDDLPIAVAKTVTKAKTAEMRERHDRQRQKLAADLRRIEEQMKSEAFSVDIRRRLSKIRTQLKRKSPAKKRTKSVRFAANVKKDSAHRVMN